MSRSVILAAGLFATGLAMGAPFADPTRPAAATEGAGAPGGAETGPRVESILIAPDRRIAVINGEPVMLGGRTAAGQVIRITESEVVIRGAEGEQTLKLFPELASRAPVLQRRTPQ
jgi:MSHA biogenesis protein MshK